MPRIRRHLSPSVASGAHPEPVTFFSASAFDATGILVGLDPAASSYWWLPELRMEPLEPSGTALTVATATTVAPSRPGTTTAGSSRGGDARHAARRSTAVKPAAA